MANRTVRCGACGNEVFVRALPPAAGKPPVKSGGKSVKKAGGHAGGKGVGVASARRRSDVPLVYMSRGKVVALISVACVFLAGLIFYMGPVRVWRQWQDMEPKANGDVSDTITFALQAYLSNNGEYDPNNTHMTPTVQGPVEFFSPFFAMSMPNSVIFHGKTNQGNFMGIYNPNSGELEADVDYGGYSFAGLVDIKKATGKIHITGRYNNGSPQAELNGTSMHIYYPPTVPGQ